VLLPIAHDDTEFDRVDLDRVLSTVHRAAVENSRISWSAIKM